MLIRAAVATDAPAMTELLNRIIAIGGTTAHQHPKSAEQVREAAALVRSGQVRVNGGRAKAERKLEAGDEVRIPPVRLAEAGERQAASSTQQDGPTEAEKRAERRARTEAAAAKAKQQGDGSKKSGTEEEEEKSDTP